MTEAQSRDLRLGLTHWETVAEAIGLDELIKRKMLWKEEDWGLGTKILKNAHT